MTQSVEPQTNVGGPGGPEEGVARLIARVAARLFAARGYDATSVREIAEAAGVTKPTLYYHFGSKEGLAQALLDRPVAALTAEIQASLDRGGDPVAVLATLVQAHFRFCLEDPDRMRFLLALFFGPLGSGLAAQMGESNCSFDRQMSDAVTGLVQAGRVAPERARGFQNAVRGLIVTHTIDYLYRGQNLEPEMACPLIDDLLRGFGEPVTGRKGA